MNTSIFKTLKDTFVNGTSKSNSSIVELCITELSSGNFPKAIDLSEELIKKDINDSIGWATKALSQAYLFDYNENLYFLKSSLTALDEFKNKTTLSNKEIMNVEAVFYTTVLDRTISLVTERVEEVVALRRKAQAEKTKATMATIGSAFSMYAGNQSNSNVGKMFGYGGAVAGGFASVQFEANAELLNSASKGVFGVAIANISMTIESAMTLKQNLPELDLTIKNEATSTLRNWVTTLAFLYQQVIENLLYYSNNLLKMSVLKKTFGDTAINISNTHEVVQFIYLSKVLGIENSIPEFNTIEENLAKLRSLDVSNIKSSISNMIMIRNLTFPIGFVLMVVGGTNEIVPLAVFGALLFYLGWLGAKIYFKTNPLGQVGELKKIFEKLAKSVNNFKFSSDNLFIENMIP